MAIRFLILLIVACGLHQAEAQEFPIGVGDTLRIEVYNEPDLNVRAKVGQTGQLRLALLGDFAVAGKTPAALSREIEVAYFDGYLVNPSVTVIVEKYRPIYVRGAVVTPGAYAFEYDMTVEQAVALAKGLKDRASNRDWFIIRGPDKDRIRADKNQRVMPGDIIEIEESLF